MEETDFTTVLPAMITYISGLSKKDNTLNDVSIN